MKPDVMSCAHTLLSSVGSRGAARQRNIRQTAKVRAKMRKSYR